MHDTMNKKVTLIEDLARLKDEEKISLGKDEV